MQRMQLKGMTLKEQMAFNKECWEAVGGFKPNCPETLKRFRKEQERRLSGKKTSKYPW